MNRQIYIFHNEKTQPYHNRSGNLTAETLFKYAENAATSHVTTGCFQLYENGNRDVFLLTRATKSLNHLSVERLLFKYIYVYICVLYECERESYSEMKCTCL